MEKLVEEGLLRAEYFALELKESLKDYVHLSYSVEEEVVKHNSPVHTLRHLNSHFPKEYYLYY